MKPNPIKQNWVRYLLQWGVLAALVFFLSGLAQMFFPKMEPADPETLCPVGTLAGIIPRTGYCTGG